MVPTPRHAWTIGRLLAGKPVKGEVDELLPPFRAIGRRMFELPFESRQVAWESFLDGQEDRDEIVAAVAMIKPEGERPDHPDQAEEPGDEWEPIRLGTIPPAEPFPVDVLPEPLVRFVNDAAAAIGCPPDFVAVPALVVAGGVIGRSVSLKLKDGYFASSCVWAACVGPPSDGKTPAFKAVTEAVKRIDELLEIAHKEALARWEEESNKPTAEGKRSKPPPPPRPQRIDVDDITMEALPLLLADNHRGLVRITDELTSIMLGMNQYKGGKGNDRAILLKIWSGDAIKKDRVGHEANIPIRCPHPCLSIVGGLPPDMLGSMVDPKGRSDGFLDRWLFTYPESLPVPDWSGRGIPVESSDDWRDLVARLWARSMNVKEGRPVPHVCFFTPEGEASWVEHYNVHSAEMNAPEFPPSLRGPWGKLREYAGRLALILACVRHAADPTLDPSAVPRVGPRVVGYAWRLVAYFKAHARRVHQAIALGPGSGGDAYKAIVGWIRRGQRASFSESELKQARRWITDVALAEALGALTRRNAIREAPDDKPTGGRPRLPVYLVNPALLLTENPEKP